MAEITKYNSRTITEMMSRIETDKYNPVSIQKSIFDLLDEVTNGELDIVDPTNPFVFLMESSCVNTAMILKENLINLRKQYPSLAQNENDLYHHMSDVDYIGRFSSPSSTHITLTLQLNDIRNKFIYDNNLPGKKGVIPRNTEITVDNITFSLQYPIEIIEFDNGVVQIRYITDTESPLQILTSNIIDYKVKTDVDNIQWVYFDVPVQQFKITTSYYPIQDSFLFQETVEIPDQFYYCRVWTKNNLQQWVEVNTTHTDQVYDPLVPTALLKVLDGYLTVTIPNIYINNGLIYDSVRVDVYSTKGALHLDLSNYDILAFNINLKAIDTNADENVYTGAMSLASLYAYSSNLINSGNDGITFEELKSRVINNSLGTKNLPITNVQLDAFVNDKGFNLVKNIDTVTNRIFLATKSLPNPFNPQLLTPASIGINTFITDIAVLKTTSVVKDNGDRVTLLSDTLFKLTNGVLSIVDTSELNTLNNLPKSNLVTEVNNNKYLYIPYYYVLDSSSNEFDLRAYDLDSPTITDLSFVSQNETLQLPVNTGTYKVEKVPTGYKITVTTKSGNFYKQLNDSEVSAQIGFKPKGVNRLTFINGDIVGLTSEGERIFSFLINTNYDISVDDYITITNSRLFDSNYIDVETLLDLDLHIFYNTTSLTPNYQSDEADSLIGKFILPAGTTAVTHEIVNLKLGNSLKNLWTRSRIIPTGLNYDRYINDVPLLYEEVVYDIDPVTNSIFTIDINGNLVYNILHNIGDPVLDSNGNPVYKHRAGDIKLDSNGEPIIIDQLSSNKELDILLVDGKYYFSDDVNVVTYKDELKNTLTNWIVNDLIDIQKILLEQTKIFFYTKKNLGLIEVKPENENNILLDSEQSFKIDLFVSDDVYNNLDIRRNLITDTIKLINDYITNNKLIKVVDIYKILNNLYGETVVSFEVSGLGGSNNYNIVKVLDEENSLSLKKKLVLQQDNTIVLEEDVEITFNNLGLV